MTPSNHCIINTKTAQRRLCCFFHPYTLQEVFSDVLDRLASRIRHRFCSWSAPLKRPVAFRQVIPSKRAHFGLKLFAFCDKSGYLFYCALQEDIRPPSDDTPAWCYWSNCLPGGWPTGPELPGLLLYLPATNHLPSWLPDRSVWYSTTEPNSVAS